MKKTLRAITVLSLAMIMAAGSVLCMPGMVYAADSTGNPKATNVSYVMKDGKKTGIKSFSIDPYTYYNLSQDKDINPKGDAVIELNDSKLRDIATYQIFPQWSVIAEGIFRDQADQLVTIEGSGMMSSSKTADNSFDRQFSYTKKGVNQDYKKYDWAVSDLAEALSKKTSAHQGKLCWDEVRMTGVTAINNLADARRLMGQELRNCSDDNDITTDDFLGNGKGKDKTDNKYRLPDLENDKTGNGYASVVTCVNRKGSSGDYDYVTFGLAVYDFDISPIAAENLKYIEEADNVENGDKILLGTAGDNIDMPGIKFSNVSGEGVTSYLKNSTPQETTHTAALKNTTTESNTISTQESYQWGMSQSVGVNINMGTLFSETARVTGLLPRATLMLNHSWNESWGTIKGKQDTKTTADERGLNTSVTLPGYTVAKLTQNVNDKNTTEKYQQPVVLNYKIAIFAMSGDYYNGVTGGIDSSTYDKSWMSVIFDGSDRNIAIGNSALNSLYNRAIVNKDTQGYDGARGKYRSWCDKNAWNSSNKINWNSIASELTDTNEDRASHNIVSARTSKKSTLEDIASELPLMEHAYMLESSQKNITSSVDQIVALYPLGSVELAKDDKVFITRPHEVLHLDGLELKGLNTKNGNFYGFKDSWGEWKIYDSKNEKVIEDGSAEDKDGKKDGNVEYGNFTLNNNDTLKSQSVIVSNYAQNDEEIYLKWVIDSSDKTRIVSNENLISDEKPFMTAQEKANVKTPAIQVIVKDDSSDAASVEVEGTYSGRYDEKINLGQKLSARVLDTTGKVRGFPIYWEEKGSGGIDVSENGDTEFTMAGTYKVRAYTYTNGAKKIYSDWVDITARNEEELAEIKMTDPELSEEELKLDKKHPSREYNLNSYLEFYDQYGDKYDAYFDNSEGKWVTREVPEVEFSVNDEGASVSSDGVLTAREPGTYTVSARAYVTDGDGNKEYLQHKINSIKLKVTREDWLESIELEAPAMSAKDLQLQDENDVVTINSLSDQLNYYDQSGEPWEGKKPAVKFSVNSDSDKAEVKNGNLYIYEPGYYTLSATTSGYDINSINLSVTENSHLVIKTKDPSVLKFTDAQNEIALNIGKYVEYTTQFGGSWSGSKPEVEYSMDDGVTGAKIEERTEVNEDSGTSTRYTAFVATEPGTFRVHVKPQKAGQYSDDIDDIIVKVEKYRTVGSVYVRMNDVSEDLCINKFEGVNDVKFDLKDYIGYRDRSGKEIEENATDVDYPDVKFAFYEDEDEGIAAPAEDEAVLKNGVLTAYKPGRYYIRVYSTREGVEGDYTMVTVEDITWRHNFNLENGWEKSGDYMVNRCLGHDTDGDGTVDEDCEYVIREPIIAPEHDCEAQGEASTTVEYTVEKEATCEEDGILVKKLKCTNCGEVLESTETAIPKLDHYDFEYKTTEATCTEAGSDFYECKLCGETVLDRVIPATGHKWGEPEYSWSADNSECTATMACVRDSSHVVSETVKAVAEPDKEKPASCTEEGDVVYTASFENEAFEDQKKEVKGEPAPGHDFGEPEYTWSADNDTCTASIKCSRCDKSIKETVDSTTRTIDPTCDVKGKTRFTAKFENAVFDTQMKYVDTKPALGHKWDSGKVSRQATETEEGEKTFTCTVCDATKTESIPKLSPAPAPAPAPKPTPAVKAPAVPTISTTETYSKKSMKVAWKKVNGATGYIVAFRKAGAAKWTTKRTTKLTMNLTGQKNKGLYEYKVASYKTAGGKTAASKYSKVSYRYINAKTPKLTRGSKLIKVSWAKDSNVTRYKVQYSLYKNMKSAKTRYVSGSGKDVTIKGLKSGKTYYVKLIPLKNYKGHEYVGQYTIRSIKTK